MGIRKPVVKKEVTPEVKKSHDVGVIMPYKIGDRGIITIIAFGKAYGVDDPEKFSWINDFFEFDSSGHVVKIRESSVDGFICQKSKPVIQGLPETKPEVKEEKTVIKPVAPVKKVIVHVKKKE
jgi:hypothetical protein